MQASQPPQSFVIGSQWPLWDNDGFSELQAQRLAAKEGFKVEWSEYTGPKKKLPYSLEYSCGTKPLDAEWCSFSIIVERTNEPQTTTIKVDLGHSHGPPSTSQKEAFRRKALGIVAKLEREILDKAKDELRKLKVRADYLATGPDTQDAGGRARPAAEQALIVWDVAIGIGETAGRNLEKWMRKNLVTADWYPLNSVLDIASLGYRLYSPPLAHSILPTTPFDGPTPPSPLKRSTNSTKPPKASKTSKTSTTSKSSERSSTGSTQRVKASLSSLPNQVPVVQARSTSKTPLPPSKTTWSTTEHFKAFIRRFSSSPDHTFRISFDENARRTHTTAQCVENPHCPFIVSVKERKDEGGSFVLDRGSSCYNHSHLIATSSTKLRKRDRVEDVSTSGSSSGSDSDDADDEDRNAMTGASFETVGKRKAEVAPAVGKQRKPARKVVVRRDENEQAEATSRYEPFPLAEPASTLSSPLANTGSSNAEYGDTAEVPSGQGLAPSTTGSTMEVSEVMALAGFVDNQWVQDPAFTLPDDLILRGSSPVHAANLDNFDSYIPSEAGLAALAEFPNGSSVLCSSSTSFGLPGLHSPVSTTRGAATPLDGSIQAVSPSDTIDSSRTDHAIYSPLSNATVASSSHAVLASPLTQMTSPSVSTTTHTTPLHDYLVSLDLSLNFDYPSFKPVLEKIGIKTPAQLEMIGRRMPDKLVASLQLDGGVPSLVAEMFK
ncbi:hypothetical protein JCM10212_006532, partial [Sporobolomyces blumeae]